MKSTEFHCGVQDHSLFSVTLLRPTLVLTLAQTLNDMNTIFTWTRHLLGAIAFYTCIPISGRWNLEFRYVARLAPLVGLLIGLLLAIANTALLQLYSSAFTRAGIIVLLWLGLTGGLHLDGAMDTADGLAVTDPKRRLSVMADSQTGAFGVMSAIAILLLKVLSLVDLMNFPVVHQNIVIALAAAWGRWGQQWAIAQYPYLKATGKGAFHKAALPSVWFCVPNLVLLGSLHVLWAWLTSISLLQTGAIALLAIGTAMLTGAWFAHCLSGQTGDTYGAIVEWTEALILPLSLLIFSTPLV